MSVETCKTFLEGAATSTRRAKVRVAINAITELTPKYGSRVYLLALAQALSELPNIDLVLLVGKGHSEYLPSRLQRFAKEVSVPAGRSYWQCLLQHRIDRCLQESNVDIYHVPNSSPLFPKRVKTVVTIHDLVDLRIHKYGAARTLYRRLINYTAAHAADLVLTVSHNSKRDLVQLLRIPEGKIIVIYPGVDQAFRPLDHEECKAYLSSKYSLTKEFILATGGLSRNKNVYGLLSAFAQLQSSGVSHLLVLTGEADRHEMRSIASSIAELRLSDKVIFTGHVPTADLPRFYNACSAGAYVSLYEGFGLPILEGMACGAPMVVSETSSMPEVVGNAALKVNPHDSNAIALSLQRILFSPELRKDLILHGFDRARSFSWSQTAARTADAYFQMAHQTSS